MDFEQLYNTYFMQVYSYVMTMMRDSHLAEEITQEVFFKAMKSESKYQGTSSELTWLCAIAKNTCMDHLRKSSKQKDVDMEALIDNMCLEQTVEDQSMSLAIHQILHQLDEPYKEVFSLRVFGDLSFERIGIIFGKTETWARVTYHRAKIKIQEKLTLD